MWKRRRNDKEAKYMREEVSFVKVKQGNRFKMTNKGKTYSVLVTYVNYGLYILDFYYDGEFRTSKAVDKQFFKDNKEIIEWSGQSGNA